jgi:hypothetical protein
MLLAQSAVIVPVLLLTCDALAGGAADGGVSVVAAGACVSPSPAGGACVVSPSPAGGGASVGQLPLASTGAPSGHDCAYEGCSIDDGDDDCTVRTAADVMTRIILIIIIDSLPFISVISF